MMMFHIDIRQAANESDETKSACHSFQSLARNTEGAELGHAVSMKVNHSLYKYSWSSLPDLFLVWLIVSIKATSRFSSFFSFKVQTIDGTTWVPVTGEAASHQWHINTLAAQKHRLSCGLCWRRDGCARSLQLSVCRLRQKHRPSADFSTFVCMCVCLCVSSYKFCALVSRKTCHGVTLCLMILKAAC